MIRSIFGQGVEAKLSSENISQNKWFHFMLMNDTDDGNDDMITYFNKMWSADYYLWMG